MSIARDIANWIATTTRKGGIELATAAEVTAGSDTDRAVVPADLKTELDKKIDDATGTIGNLMELAAGGQLADSGLDAAQVPQLDQNVEFGKDATFDALYSNGAGTSWTTTWTNGNKQSRTMTGNGTATFVAPSGPCNVVLQITNSGGARSITWPATVKWANGTKPPASTGVDIYTFFFNGTNYYGGAILACS